MIEPETREYLKDAETELREYLGGKWTIVPSKEPGASRRVIIGNDGDPIVVCAVHNAAHWLTPEAVAEYLIEQHGAAKRLAARERDIKRAVGYLRLRCDGDHPLYEMAGHVMAAIRELEPKPEAPDEKV